jgi:peptidoglycan/LPS O-acetylase OafA/YrhL
VDLFFVISGFIMWHTTRDQSGALPALRFILRRFARIFLGYWPWLAVAVVVFIYYRPHGIDDKDMVSSILLLPQPNETNVLSPSWTLSFELLFYMLFAAAMMMLPRLFIVPAFAVIAGAALLVGTRGAPYWFVLNPLLAEFALGVAIAAAVERFGAPLPWLGLVLCIVFFYLGTFGSHPTDRLWRTVTFGVAAAGLVYAAAGFELRRRVVPRALSSLGDASYSLYLSHVPILFLVIWTMFETLKGAPDSSFLILLCVILALSLTAYRLIERPLHRLASQLINSKLQDARATPDKMPLPHPTNSSVLSHSSPSSALATQVRTPPQRASMGTKALQTRTGANSSSGRVPS